MARLTDSEALEQIKAVLTANKGELSHDDIVKALENAGQAEAVKSLPKFANSGYGIKAVVVAVAGQKSFIKYSL